MLRPGIWAHGAVLALVAAMAAGPGRAADPVLPGAELLHPGVTLRVLEGPSPSEAIDETGLRYYVATGDLEAAEAELRRLKTLYPGWSPPADLMRNPWGGANERPVWTEIHAGRHAAARQAMTRLQSERPDWRPSPSLLREIERGELRARLALWRDAGNWAAIRVALEGLSEAGDCATPDIAWLYAEASARVGLREDARRTYQLLVEACPAFEIRLASLQKASELLSWEAVDALVRAETPRPRGMDQQRRLASLRADLLRARLAALADGRAGPVSAVTVAGMERAVEAARDGRAAVSLGWWHYHARRYDVAARWFERGLAWGSGATGSAE